MLTAGLLVGTGLGTLILFIFWRIEPGSTYLPEGLRAGAALPAPSIGLAAPNFELEMLDGQRAHLADFQGKPVLLNFWATWCGPCRVEMPFFQERYDLHQDDFTILAINNAEPPALVQEYVEELGLTFLILLDPEAAVQRQYLVRGYPTSVFIDADGIIRVYHVGVISESQLNKYLQELGVDG